MAALLFLKSVTLCYQYKFKFQNKFLQFCLSCEVVQPLQASMVSWLDIENFYS